MSRARLAELLFRYKVANVCPLIIAIIIVILALALMFYAGNRCKRAKHYNLKKIYPHIIRNCNYSALAAFVLLVAAGITFIVVYIRGDVSYQKTPAVRVQYAMIAKNYERKLPKQEKYSYKGSLNNYINGKKNQKRVKFEKAFVKKYGHLKHLHGPTFIDYTFRVNKIHTKNNAELSHMRFDD